MEISNFKCYYLRGAFTTSALKAALNFRRVFFIGQKISDFIFLSSFFRPAQSRVARNPPYGF